MRNRSLVALLVVGFAVAACMPRAQVPLPRAAGSGADDRLVGLWVAEIEGERVEVAVTRAGEDRLDVVAHAVPDPAEGDDEGEPERLVLEATTSAIAGRGYLSFRVLDAGEDDDVGSDGFYICLYELGPGDALAVRCLATDPVAEDVEAGLVAGTVERGEYVTEVTLTADGAALADYLSAADAGRLFPEAVGVFWREGH